MTDKYCNLLIGNDAFQTWIYHFTGQRLENGQSLLMNHFSRFYLDKFEPCYQSALEGKTITTVEDMYVDGVQKFSTVNFNPAHDKGGDISGVICHASDITEQRLQLMQLNEQANILIDIAHIQSHKVRGPVASILGLAQLFNPDDLTDPDNRDIMIGIIASTEHLDELIREVIVKINRLSNKRQNNAT